MIFEHDGKIHCMPDEFFKKGDLAPKVWNNCYYIHNPKDGFGRIYYYENDETFKLISSNIRSYYVNGYHSMPYYIEKLGYAFFNTTESNEEFLLDCTTGKVVHHGNFEVDISKCRMEFTHSRSLFIFKTDSEKTLEYILTDNEGNYLLPKKYQGDGKKVEFIVNDSFGGIVPLRFRKRIQKKRNDGYTYYIYKEGILHCINGKVIQVIPAKYDDIDIHYGAIEDSNGKFHYPTYVAKTEDKNGKQHTVYYTFIGEVIKQK